MFFTLKSLHGILVEPITLFTRVNFLQLTKIPKLQRKCSHILHIKRTLKLSITILLLSIALNIIYYKLINIEKKE